MTLEWIDIYPILTVNSSSGIYHLDQKLCQVFTQLFRCFYSKQDTNIIFLDDD